ncbi:MULTISPECIES: DUF6904 family protein [Lysinibacillus]|uniref:DUF2785 domain-containing protein n=2 Tax=Lysinibacillus TaxID=400634 RepID=A0ABY2TDL3_9BACI|nr:MULTISPECIES: hypothetical protein [Lysinibacillus]AHN23786.1 hypothetical protein T479_23160 [Lysinibacillus varians]TKI45462.1 hypothetical protein FC748_19695 [Lysinibacillus tabacifolii]TKI65713.1 hypothetical protein FC752_07580 [Lysinibacillus varians]
MLSIQSTEQLTGVRISGDFWDLDALIQAIYQVTGDENKYYDYQGARLRILGICRNLHQAMQGEHQLEFVSNGLNKSILSRHETIFPTKNVYYGTEVLWPELLFTAIALNDFIRLHQELIDSSDWNGDVATIRKFQAAVADCLEQELTEDEFLVFLRMIHSKSPLTFRYATQYVDVLNLEYIDLNTQTRKAHLASFALRLMLEDEEYVALKSQLIEVASTTKKALHEIPINASYPEEILW